jgi:sucrose-phosphate synthase
MLPIALASSRLDKKKNHLGIVRAFVENNDLRESANLAIVVRGLVDPLHNYKSLSSDEKSVMDEIVSTINTNNLWDSVLALSLNSQTELASAYRILSARQSCFVLTALYEPFGLAPLEAMSCGLPAVVTQNGGPSESMRDGNEEYGVLVDPTSPQDIAQGILRIISSESAWRRYHLAGMRRVKEKYTWERTAAGYLEVFGDILDGKNTAQKKLDIPQFMVNVDDTDEKPVAKLKKLFLKS